MNRQRGRTKRMKTDDGRGAEEKCRGIIGAEFNACPVHDAVRRD